MSSTEEDIIMSQIKLVSNILLCPVDISIVHIVVVVTQIVLFIPPFSNSSETESRPTQGHLLHTKCM